MARHGAPGSGQYLRGFSLDHAAIHDRGAYPVSLPALAGFDHIDLHPDVTCVIGENGSGTSTLLEALAVVSGFNPEGGSRNFNFATGESHSQLANYLRPRYLSKD